MSNANGLSGSRSTIGCERPIGGGGAASFCGHVSASVCANRKASLRMAFTGLSSFVHVRAACLILGICVNTHTHTQAQLPPHLTFPIGVRRFSRPTHKCTHTHTRSQKRTKLSHWRRPGSSEPAQCGTTQGVDPQHTNCSTAIQVNATQMARQLRGVAAKPNWRRACGGVAMASVLGSGNVMPDARADFGWTTIAAV